LEDVTPKVGGVTIPPLALQTEPQTGRLRAVPDNDGLVEYMKDFFSLPLPNRMIKSRDAVLQTRENYSWDDTANKWYDYFKTVDVSQYEQKWQSPLRVKKPAPYTEQQDMMTNMQFCEWLIKYVLCDERQMHSYLHMRLLRDINNGFTLTYGNNPSYFSEDSVADGRPNVTDFSRKKAYQEILNICTEFNLWEQKRCK